MKSIYKIALILLFLSIQKNINAQTENNMKNTGKSQLDQEVLTTIKSFMDAFDSRNINSLMTFYDENAIVVFDGASPTYGKKDIRELFIGAFSMQANLKIRDEQLFIVNDVATHFSVWDMSGITPDGENFTTKGLSVLSLKKQNDGKWIIQLDNPQALYLLNKSN